MTPEIEQVYLEELNQRQQTDARYSIIVEMVVNSGRLVELRLRPDATLFLANNMIDMIISPLQSAPEKYRWFNQGGDFTADLFKILADDMTAIVSVAADIARSRERDYISSTSALYAVARVLPELRINQVQLWGRSTSHISQN